MEILILGGTKFFGKAFALAAAKDGHKVSVYSRACPVKDLPKSIKQIKGQRSDLSKLAKKRWDFVLDNICYTAKDMKEAIKTFSGKTKHYVFLSSGDVHLAVEGAVSPFGEEIAHKLPRKRGKVDPYGKGKYEAEVALRKSPLPYSIVRFPIVIGKGDPKARLEVYIKDIVYNKPIILPDGGKYKRRFIFIEDTTAALKAVMQNREKCVGKVVHFGDKAITLKSFIKACFKYCNKKINTVDISAEILKRANYDFAKENPYFNPFDYVLGIKNAKLLAWRHNPSEKWLKNIVSFYAKEARAEARKEASKKA
ncbi:MAG: NAD-dependent epimerase/dehydratase family protein [Elusimicrobiota bacterium]|jgi:nucleoside-diphosphate-sugar epimerase|nr:NAD-dependent epimerase/dehydratase family protein [Elusimicrobiota bacterium]